MQRRTKATCGGHCEYGISGQGPHDSKMCSAVILITLVPKEMHFIWMYERKYNSKSSQDTITLRSDRIQTLPVTLMLRQGPIASGGHEELENQDLGGKVKEIGFFEENYQRLLIKNIL